MGILKGLLARGVWVLGVAAGYSILSCPAAAQTAAACPPPSKCQRLVVAKVVAVNQTLTFNRLGSQLPSPTPSSRGGMIFVLLRDAVDSSGKPCDQAGASCTAGNTTVRPDKRPRPIVLRVNAGDCLDVEFTNLTSQPLVGMHIMGMELRTNIADDASWAGKNPKSFASNDAPAGGTPRPVSYQYFAKEEGTFFLYSLDDAGAGQLQSGLFGSVNVEPEGAEYYRSQVTREVLDKATYRTNQTPSAGMARMLSAMTPVRGEYLTKDQHPVIKYDATDANGMPVLEMTRRLPDVAIDGAPVPQFELIATDLTAIVTGPQAGWFPDNNCSPSFATNSAYPERRRPYREFSIHYHNIGTGINPFVAGLSPALESDIQAGYDEFGINYGIAGIGPEVLANRLGVGPEKDCVECKFEEFFLSSWTVGDPAMVVDNPANSGTKATSVSFPDDPSNVYHSYLGDHVKFRIHNAATEPHVHHQHAHQWLHSPNDSNSEYLDSQMIVPGASYTLEIAYGGSGNRNLTAGDSIFHCHFYPHFAQGMWALWRVHDTFESGTELQANNKGKLVPKPSARALPDGEIETGTPIPAIVPLPGQAMAPLPAQIQLLDKGTRVKVLPDSSGKINNPGYPFFVPGVAGHRPPHPPCDFAWEGEDKVDARCEPSATQRNYFNGGLPRHLVLSGQVVREFHTRWDFTKDFIRYDDQNKPVAGGLKAFQLPEEGTAAERAAMDQHAICDIPSFLPDGQAGPFRLNGRPGVPGGPFANPNSIACKPMGYQVRYYKAAVVQTDAVLNKKGWHYPQQRLITLWGDVLPTVNGDRAPQPFFFRANSAETIEFWHTNLVPSYYELDDFQVRTPTDILGQHIHLVKFDVLASDGAANGFNYEDGTLSPDDVRDRIAAINQQNGLFAFDPKTQFQDPDPKKQTKLIVQAPPKEICGAPGKECRDDWMGAQATIQRWSSDTLVNEDGADRTLRTVFTHDHFGPSTHQQAGLYAGLLIEPTCSKWFEPDKDVNGSVADRYKGSEMYTRPDGGPTSWEAIIETYKDCAKGTEVTAGLPLLDSYREFALEFQDLQLAYTATSPSKTSADKSKTSILFTSSFDGTQWPLILAGLNSGKANLALVKQFQLNGITFQPDHAAVTVQTPGQVWRVQVTDPAHTRQPDPRQQYRVEATTPPAGNAGAVNVFSDNMPPGWTSVDTAIAPPQPAAPDVANSPPYPGLVTSSSGGVGAYSLNYRNEPIPTRVDPVGKDCSQAPTACDMAYVFKSIPRLDLDLNRQPKGSPINPADPSGFKFPPLLTPELELGPYDPYTPLLRAYQNDKVQIRTLAGAHLLGHSFQGYGFKWPFEPRADWTAGSSGYRSAQGIGLSEHFEMLFRLPPSPPAIPTADYLYEASSDFVGLENGLWGIMRAYNPQKEEPRLLPLRTASPGSLSVPAPNCPKTVRANVVAVNAGKALPGGALVYNGASVPIESDSDAVLFVRGEDLNPDGTFKTCGKNPDGTPKTCVPVEPLILRANAGDCIEVHLQSQLTGAPVTTQIPPAVLAPFTGSPVPKFFALNPPSRGSTNIGLHAQLVSYDLTSSDGLNVGLNPDQTVAPAPPGAPPVEKVYRWYAGEPQTNADGTVQWVPVEFGSIPLTPADPLIQRVRGLIGALIIEPQGSTAVVDETKTRAVATIAKPDGSTFREFVAIIQDDVVPASGLAVNYSDEDGTARSNPPGPIFFSNCAITPPRDPQTPIFTANTNQAVRFRFVFPGGTAPQVVSVHGHAWQEEPYISNSDGVPTQIGFNKSSQWLGSQQISPNEHVDMLFDSAGGKHNVAGDYLYHLFNQSYQGLWGLMRVGPDQTLTCPAPVTSGAADAATPRVLPSARQREKQ